MSKQLIAMRPVKAGLSGLAVIEGPKANVTAQGVGPSTAYIIMRGGRVFSAPLQSGIFGWTAVIPLRDGVVDAAAVANPKELLLYGIAPGVRLDANAIKSLIPMDQGELEQSETSKPPEAAPTPNKPKEEPPVLQPAPPAYTLPESMRPQMPEPILEPPVSPPPQPWSYIESDQAPTPDLSMERVPDLITERVQDLKMAQTEDFQEDMEDIVGEPELSYDSSQTSPLHPPSENFTMPSPINFNPPTFPQAYPNIERMGDMPDDFPFRSMQGLTPSAPQTQQQSAPPAPFGKYMDGGTAHQASIEDRSMRDGAASDGARPFDGNAAYYMNADEGIDFGDIYTPKPEMTIGTEPIDVPEYLVDFPPMQDIHYSSMKSSDFNNAANSPNAEPSNQKNIPSSANARSPIDPLDEFRPEPVEVFGRSLEREVYKDAEPSVSAGFDPADEFRPQPVASYGLETEDAEKAMSAGADGLNPQTLDEFRPRPVAVYGEKNAAAIETASITPYAAPEQKGGSINRAIDANDEFRPEPVAVYGNDGLKESEPKEVIANISDNTSINEGGADKATDIEVSAKAAEIELVGQGELVEVNSHKEGDEDMRQHYGDRWAVDPYSDNYEKPRTLAYDDSDQLSVSARETSGAPQDCDNCKQGSGGLAALSVAMRGNDNYDRDSAAEAAKTKEQRRPQQIDAPTNFPGELMTQDLRNTDQNINPDRIHMQPYQNWPELGSGQSAPPNFRTEQQPYGPPSFSNIHGNHGYQPMPPPSLPNPNFPDPFNRGDRPSGVFTNAFAQFWPYLDWYVYRMQNGTHYLSTRRNGRTFFAVPGPPSVYPPAGIPDRARYIRARNGTGYWVF